ncbi:MAG: DoxX family protein [Bacteroidota bacterium]
MTLSALVIGISLFALALTGLEKAMDRKLIKNFLLSFLQNFTGGLFIFSGLVKAVDPLGTAYKMEQYFAEFETTFAGTKAAFLAPTFPALAEYAIAFSVFMIVFEIVLGVALLNGAMKKFASWAFFLMVLFFTFLTGFTYLTGFVPEGVNFFQFGQWGDYEATSMKVTDCGCFGDFLKLEPRVSFLKDVFLLIPAFIFLFSTKSFHTLEKASMRAIAVGSAMVVSLLVIYLNGYSLGLRTILITVALIATQYVPTKWVVWAGVAALTIYSMSNYVTDIPEVDFRPFKVNANIAERKALEEEAENNVKVLAYSMTNKASGEVVELPFDVYLQEYAKYPAEEWELEQVKSEPEVPRTKISDFEVSDLQGNDLTEDILQENGSSFMVVAYKLYGTEQVEISMLPDTTFAVDTLITETDTTYAPRVVEIGEREVRKTTYTWDENYLTRWREEFLPKIEAAVAAGVRTYVITAYSDPERIASFQQALGTDITFYMADDILLKTIVRSNPGPVLMQAGKILNKWHHRKLPEFTDIATSYLSEAR